VLVREEKDGQATKSRLLGVLNAALSAYHEMERLKREVGTLRAERRALEGATLLAFPPDYPALIVVLPWEGTPLLFSTYPPSSPLTHRLLIWLERDRGLRRFLDRVLELADGAKGRR
jgi:hypothetical protein